MPRIQDTEREAIISTISGMTGSVDVEGICVYGSRIAGYPRPDSDYDLIIALRNYRARVRYRYVTGEVEVSAILVDASSLMSDSANASMGEFVAGRFLNPFEAITGEEFFSKVERTYKRRVVLETLDELRTDFGHFAEDLLIPVEYLLFEKLRKRASLYPPVLYSYAQTYGGAQGVENLRKSCEVFLSCISELEDQGVEISLDGRAFRVGSGRRGRQFGKIQTAVSSTQRGIRHYAVHGYAGRVRPSIVKKELLSKMSRVREVGDLPIELKDPKRLLGVEEGLLIMEVDLWLERFMERSGIGTDAKISKKKMGSSSVLYRISRDGMSQQLFAKKFRTAESIRALFSNVRAIPSRAADFTPLARLHREYSSAPLLRRIGMNIPKIRAVVLPQRIIVREFVEGRDLETIIRGLNHKEEPDLSIFRNFGQMLSTIHSAGLALGDARPSKIIASATDGSFYLGDLENVTIGGDASWDLSEFLYNSLSPDMQIETARAIVRTFLQGYLKGGRPQDLTIAMKPKYLLPFREGISHVVANMVRQELSESISRIS